MDTLEVSTVVYLDPPTVYEFLVDFEGYAGYSDYLDSVVRDGVGGPGTVYDVDVSWWRLDHTVRSEVTDVQPPARIDWRLLGSLGARGAWHVEGLTDGELADGDHADTTPGTVASRDGPASRVTLVIRYDPDSVDGSRLDLPSFVPLDAVVNRVVPLVQEEAERVVERIVADLEGEPREVHLQVETVPDDDG